MKQSLLRISLPEEGAPLYPSEFRELLARSGNDSPSLPPAFFHYDANGRPLNRPEPQIRTIGGRRWVGVLSMKERSDLLYQAVGVVARAVSDHLGRPLPILLEEHEFDLEATSYPVQYVVRHMAIKRRRNDTRPKEGDTPAQIEDIVRRTILRNLEQRGSHYGFDVPVDSRVSLVLHGVRSIGMRLRTTTGDTNEFVTLADADISMNIKLTGYWQFGHLQSRGYGRVIRKGHWDRNYRAVDIARGRV